MPETAWRQSRILVTGASGFVGTNLSRRLQEAGLTVTTTDVTGPVDLTCDLQDQHAIQALFDQVQPQTIFHLAAKVGGIYANVTQKADFYLDNTLINTNVLAEVQRRGIKQVLAMGAGCAYPKKLEDQLLSEASFFDGVPEVTNDAYAYTKRNMLVHLQALAEDPAFRFLYFIPSNIYGPHDNFHPKYSHVVAGLVNKFVSAKRNQSPTVTLWGTGAAKRDLLYVEDLIDAILLASDSSLNNALINIATGTLTSVSDLAHAIAKLTSFTGNITTDPSYPEGQKHRMFNTDRITELGWQPRHSLTEGLAATIAWYEASVPAPVAAAQ